MKSHSFFSFIRKPKTNLQDNNLAKQVGYQMAYQYDMEENMAQDNKWLKNEIEVRESEMINEAQNFRYTEMEKEAIDFIKKDHKNQQDLSSAKNDEGNGNSNDMFIKTGVPGFDDLISNGIPRGSQILISGGPGT